MPNGAPISGEAQQAAKTAVLPRRFTFPRDARLLKHERFRQVFDAGGEVAGGCMILWVRRADDCARRMGVVATKRTFHDAVDRNRAKRLIRETFRLSRHELVDDSWDLVILARRRILGMKQPDVQKVFMKLCHRKGIVKQPDEQ